MPFDAHREFRNCLPLAAVLLLTVTLLVACSGTRDAGMPDAVTTPEVAGLPSISALDALAAASRPAPGASPRSSSEAASFVMKGDRCLAHSPGVVLTAGSAVMSASADGFEWALYEAKNAGFECTAVTPHIDLIKPKLWIARADFEAGRWVLLGPYSSDPPGNINLSADKYYSAAGRQYFAVLCPGGAQVVAQSFDLSVEKPVAEVSTAVQGVNDGLKLLDLNGRPGLVYSGVSGELDFSLGDSADPGGVSDWNSSVIDASAFPQYYAATVHQGRVVVVYIDSLFGTLKLARAKIEHPVQDSDWETVDLPTTGTYQDLAICSDGQHVLIAVHEWDGSDIDTDSVFHYVRFLRSADSDALGSYSNYRIRGLGQGSNQQQIRLSVIVDDGRPAVSCVDELDEFFNRAFFLHANNAAPQQGQWTAYDLQNGCSQDSLVMASLGDHPAVLGNFGLLTALEPEGTPDTADPWFFDTVFADAADTPPDMVSDNGRPFCAYSFDNGGENSLTLVFFLGLPESFESRSFGERIYDNISTVGLAEVSLAMVGGVHTVAYFDPGTGQIHYVRFKVPQPL